jgi:hypothetical protein
MPRSTGELPGFGNRPPGTCARLGITNVGHVLVGGAGGGAGRDITAGACLRVVDGSRRSFTGDFCVIVIQNRGYHR